MRFHLIARLSLSKSVDEDVISKEIENFNKYLDERSSDAKIDSWSIKENVLELSIVSGTKRRAHDILLNFRNVLSKTLGKDYRVGVRGIEVDLYEVRFSLDKKPLRDISIPFADLEMYFQMFRLPLSCDLHLLRRIYLQLPSSNNPNLDPALQLSFLLCMIRVSFHSFL